MTNVFLYFLYTLSTVLFAPYMFAALAYAAPIYLIGLIFKNKRIKLYGRNIAMGVWDQGLATCWGQDTDITISEALGKAARLHDRGIAKVSKFVLFFGKFVDLIFWNPVWKIEKNHIRNSKDKGETWNGTVTHWHELYEELEEDPYIKMNKAG